MDIPDTLEERKESVITFLCEQPDDLKLVAEKMESLSRECVLYCPIEPLNHDPSTINNFFEKVEDSGRGESLNCLITLLKILDVLVASLKSYLLKH